MIRSILLLLTVILGGCTLLPSSESSERYYDLESTSTPRGQQSPSQQILLVGPIQLPEALKRSQILTRLDDNRYEIQEDILWAGALEESFTRVLSQNIEKLLGTQRVLAYPASTQVFPDLQIQVSVRRFEPVAWREVVLDAQWQILNSGNAPAAIGGNVYQLKTDGTVRDSIQKMSDAIDLLAQDIRDDLFGSEQKLPSAPET